MGVLQPGEEIDVWVVDRALGQGGMGSVYRCHNREAKRILAAVKVLDAAFLRLPNAKARFIREAEILFSLDHPGIVKVRNVRMDLALPYLEMEYIDGVNLETRSREGALPPAEALPLFLQVADALAYLHARGIRHRDIKPSNLVIQPNGVVKLVDFGIAMEADGATLTERGQTFGSVSYAPPEWLDPERLDPVKWDIYAAGLVFYELLTGREAFPMAGTGTMQQQVVRLMSVKQRHPPLDPGPTYPARLRALIRDMTNPWPESRLGDAGAVRARLAEVDLDEVDLAAAVASLEASAPTWYTDQADGDRAVAGLTMVPGADGAPALRTVPAGPPAERPPAAVTIDDPARPPVTPTVAPAPAAPHRAPRSALPLPVWILGAVVLLGGAAWAYTRIGSSAGPPGPEAPPAAPALTEAPVAEAPVATAAPTPAAPAIPEGAAARPEGAAAPPAAIPAPTPPVEAAVGPPAKEPGARITTTKGPGRIVTASAFARWLGTHPEWTREGAQAAGKADPDYLSGWTGAAPPEGTGGSALTNASWAAAAAYCAGRGGLPGVDAPPLTWSDAPDLPWLEYRVADGRPAWRRNDGAPSTMVEREKTYNAIGFRCAR